MSHIEVNNADALEVIRYHYAKSYRTFVRDAWKIHHPTVTMISNWHIDAICDHLEAQSRGDIQRLIINVPPGSMKSLLAGVYWSAWEWLTNPSIQVVAMAANEALSIRDNQKARWLIESPWYQTFANIKLKSDANAASKYVNDSMGFRWAIPITSITGFRADRIMIDDPISASNATSDAKRNEVNEIFWTNVITRLNDPKLSTCTLIQQRLHEDDLVGNILANTPAGRWETLILPMERTSFHHVTRIGFSDPRTEGELLFPTRWADEDIEEFKSRPYDWASQHQQDPVPTTDGLFKREWIDDNLYERKDLPKDLHYYLATDHAVDVEDKNDFNVCLVLGIDHRKHVYVIDSFRERCELKVAMGIKTDADGKLQVANKGALSFARKYEILRWFAESDNHFKGIKGLVEDAKLATKTHAPIELVSPHGKSKVLRSNALQTYCSLGRVHFEKGSRIHADAIQEFIKFPVGKHDDIVDTLSLFCRVINEAHPAILAPVGVRGEVMDGYQRRAKRSSDPRQKGLY
jgi:phage terminase large subunit-like protein